MINIVLSADGSTGYHSAKTNIPNLFMLFIATLCFTGISASTDSIDVVTAIPAEGPSFGVDPSGI